MERPPSHVVDTRGQLQLQGALVPFGWTLTPIPSDYGIDYEVEVFEN